MSLVTTATVHRTVDYDYFLNERTFLLGRDLRKSMFQA